MEKYRITLEVDEGWLEAIKNLTQNVYEDEMCKWLDVKKIGGQE